MSLTCGRSVVYSGYSGFLHKENWPWYNWNIVVLNTIPITIKKINEHDNKMKNKKYHTFRISENTIRSEYQKIPYRQNIRKYHTVRISENTILSEYQKIIDTRAKLIPLTHIYTWLLLSRYRHFYQILTAFNRLKIMSEK